MQSHTLRPHPQHQALLHSSVGGDDITNNLTKNQGDVEALATEANGLIQLHGQVVTEHILLEPETQRYSRYSTSVVSPTHPSGKPLQHLADLFYGSDEPQLIQTVNYSTYMGFQDSTWHVQRASKGQGLEEIPTMDSYSSLPSTSGESSSSTLLQNNFHNPLDQTCGNFDYRYIGIPDNMATAQLIPQIVSCFQIRAVVYLA
ncbi:hypothetical protein F4804DRAFT_297095 [Jackrogersella minutella]|nr:hypothetical protein F4804DRAFT_297095 [Jackrogersella minutella]